MHTAPPLVGGLIQTQTLFTRQHFTTTRTLTVPIPIPIPIHLRKLSCPPVPLPVLNVHPSEHLLRHPAHKKPRTCHTPLFRHTFTQPALAPHVDQSQVASDIVTLKCRRVDRHMRFAVQQPRFWRGGWGGRCGRGGRGGWHRGSLVCKCCTDKCLAQQK